MKRIFKFKVIGYFVIAVIIAAITLITVNTSGQPGFVTNALTSLSKPVKSLVASVASAYESLYGYIYEYNKIADENALLKAEIRQLKQEYREYIDISNELDELRELLGLASRHPDFDWGEADVISWNASNWASSFTINKGTYNSDVKVGDSVITETGALIGVVKAVHATSATVVTVIDTTFSVGAYIERNEDPAIAVGDFSLMQQGLLKFDYLQASIEIVAGDTILTSGSSGLLPAGLTVGTVEQVLTYDTGIRRYATIKPAADLQGLSTVYLVTGFQSGEDGDAS